MNCDETNLFLPEYLSESLGEAQELAFAAHIADCDACRAETERLGSLWKSLALIPGSSRIRAGPAGARPVLRIAGGVSAWDGIGAEAGLRERLLALWPKQPAWQMAMSFALLVIGFGVGYEIRRRTVKQEMHQQAPNESRNYVER